MSTPLPRFVNDTKPPSTEPTSPLLPKESAPESILLCGPKTPFQWIGCVLASFICFSMIFAILTVATIAALYTLTHTYYSMWTWCKIYLGVSGSLFLFGTSAEALGYVGWWVWTRWLTRYRGGAGT
ncbi:hypothetical protein F4820DRAFT_424112 [Hypoxylon rubiginosum]|uniref:Uncharacterized protein n=1 Tax=Hypoxylon rubiginosum TaxID=110542 RepID=A0ACB9YY45_9PEZI|nr:hypothetical protein F4820DRAFT_424112 [Hypoxylon rubiginosum]